MTRILLIALLSVGVMVMARTAMADPHSNAGCNNCHVPHKAATDTDPNASWGVPLWSTAQTADGLPTFTLYSSFTFDQLGTDITQPDGSSKLCLGCHDGSYSAFLYDSSDVIGAGKGMGDLSQQHPVSFTYDVALSNKVPNGKLRNPDTALSGLGGTITQDLLDIKGKVQCTSCHDIHTTGKTQYLLRWNYDVAARTDGVMCIVCHNK